MSNQIFVKCSNGAASHVLVTAYPLTVTLEFGEFHSGDFHRSNMEAISKGENPELADLYVEGVWNVGTLAALVNDYCANGGDGECESAEEQTETHSN